RPSYVLGTYGSPVSRQRLRGRGGHGTPEGFIGEQRLRRAPRRQQIGEQRPDRRLADAPVPGRGAARDRVDEAIPRVAATCTQEGSDAAGARREGRGCARSLPPSAEADGRIARIGRTRPITGPLPDPSLETPAPAPREGRRG